MRKIIILLCLIIGSVLPAQDQWPQLRGSHQNQGRIRYNGDKEINEWHYIHKTNRRYKPGLSVWSSPAAAVIEGQPMAFIGGYDQTMHALDLATKQVRWRKISNAEITGSPAIGTVNHLDTVFWSSSDRSVYANIAINGRQLWTKELIPPSSTLGEAHLSSPALHNGKIYICGFAYDKSLPRNKQKGTLYCLDMRSGHLDWTCLISNGDLSSPVIYEYASRTYIAIASRRGLLQTFTLKNGKPKKEWAFQMPHEVLGSPTITLKTKTPMLFLGSKYGNLIAVNALTGIEMWKRMAGNWIDNSVCVGEIDQEPVVFAGSHDYCVYAFGAESGEKKWKKALGGEVYSVPVFFELHGQHVLAVAALDNHLTILNARNGKIITSFFTGNPIWDQVSKGDTLWGSPVAIEAKGETAIVHGSYNDVVYVLPLEKECNLTAMVRSSESLWWSLLFVGILFGGIVLPIVILIPGKKIKSNN